MAVDDPLAFGELSSTQPAPNRFQRDSDGPADCFLRMSARMQGNNLFIPFEPTLSAIGRAPLRRGLVNHVNFR